MKQTDPEYKKKLIEAAKMLASGTTPMADRFTTALALFDKTTTLWNNDRDIRKVNQHCVIGKNAEDG